MKPPPSSVTATRRAPFTSRSSISTRLRAYLALLESMLPQTCMTTSASTIALPPFWETCTSRPGKSISAVSRRLSARTASSMGSRRTSTSSMRWRLDIASA